MSYLIFCSFEVGGLPYRFAELLNKHGVKTYYVSIDRPLHKHDSTTFHYGTDKLQDWDLSASFKKDFKSMNLIVDKLHDLKHRLDIKGCFATGSKSFLLDHADIPYAYWSFGADLDYIYPPYFFSQMRLALKKYYYRFFGKSLFSEEMVKTLNGAKKLMVSSYQKRTLNRLAIDKQLFFLPHTYSVAPDFDVLIKQKENFKAILCNEFNADYFFFSSVRQVWKNRSNLTGDSKNNDIAIKAFSLYLQKAKKDNCKLVMINKGCDVDATKKIISSLSLRDYVIWIDEAKRQDLSKYYMGADLCVGHFGTPVLTNSVLEPLSFATPCVSYYGQTVKDMPFYDEYPPVYNSNDPAEISDFMAKVHENREFAGQLEYRSWDWARRFCNENEFVDRFKGAMSW